MVSVTINHEGTKSTTSSTIDVGWDVLSATGTTNLSVPEGASGNTTIRGTVAVFTDTDTATPAGAFMATIAWGDNTTSAGTVSGSNGSFTVSGAHTYTEDGAFTAQVTVSGPGGSSPASGNSTITVTEVAVAPARVATFSTFDNVSFTAAVATFTDGGGPEAVGDYAATIDWGDNSGTSAATISQSGSIYTVSGSHAYSSAGTFTVSVTINHEGTSSSTTSIIVVSPDVLRITGTTNLSAPEGGSGNTTISGTLAAFSDGDAATPAGAFTATIAWGDSTTSPGVVSGSNGKFTVGGGHTYAEEGVFTAQVIVDGPAGSSPVSANSTITVREVAVAPAPVATISTAGNVSFTAALATFTDAGGPEAVGDYAATIHWGDQSAASPGTISLTGSTYTVIGTHSYSRGGTFTVGITITHEGTTARVSATVNVLTITSLKETNHMVNGQGVGVTGQTLNYVSTFRDAPTEIPHTATFSWGDNTSSAGTIRESVVNGAYGRKVTAGKVTAGHMYTAYGIYTVTETVTNKDGTSATTTFTVSIVPFDVQPLAIDPATGKAPLSPGKAQLVVGGSVGNDNILVQLNRLASNGSSILTYNVQIQTPGGNFQTPGDVVSPVPIALVMVWGLDGNDQVAVHDGKTTIPSWVFAGSGNDNIQVEHGNNMIVGGAGQNYIQGGTGRDFIIGGSGGGGSQLLGGQSGDLLIAGSTAYDQNTQALALINAEWDSGDPFYLRLAYLVGTRAGGRNGNNVLNANTVFHANGSDTVQGGHGTNLIFARPTGTNADSISNVRYGSVVMPI
jgi:hypothetical protein